MAILSEEGNEYEVHVVAACSGTAFEEYVKLGDREKLGAKRCDRYIVAKPGVSYIVKVMVKKGFNWGTYSQLTANLSFAGYDYKVAGWNLGRGAFKDDVTTEDIVMRLDCVNQPIHRLDAVGAPFTFASLIVGKFLF
jgi:hypothetical protein